MGFGTVTRLFLKCKSFVTNLLRLCYEIRFEMDTGLYQAGRLRLR